MFARLSVTRQLRATRVFPRSLFPRTFFLRVTAREEISPCRIRSRGGKSYSRSRLFSYKIRFLHLITRHHFSSPKSYLSYDVIKIATCRISPAYRRCNYRAHRGGKFAPVSGPCSFGVASLQECDGYGGHLKSVLINVRLSERDIASSHRLGAGTPGLRYRFAFIDFVPGFINQIPHR